MILRPCDEAAAEMNDIIEWLEKQKKTTKKKTVDYDTAVFFGCIRNRVNGLYCLN